MLRNYFMFILAVGIFAALLGRGPPEHKSQASDAARHAFDTKARQVAELKTRDAPQFSANDGSVELQRQADGHFYADVRINGAYLHMLVDTGASVIALSRDDAQIAGIATSIGMNNVVGQGADGPVHGEYVRLENVELGPLSAKNLDAVVLDRGRQSLLGQSFLSQFAAVQIDGDRMILRE
jgi:aspartyl protease family protein